MTPLKLRQLLITIHLWAAALMAPALLMVGFTGAMHIVGVGEHVERTDIPLADGQAFDLESETLEQDLRRFLTDQDINVDFEYLRMGSNSLQTRPTSRPFLTLRGTGDAQVATYNKPNLQYALMELHKGHGPQLFRTYQIVVGFTLLAIMLSGVVVGLIAPTYRRATLIGLGVGWLAFLVIGFLI